MGEASVNSSLALDEIRGVNCASRAGSATSVGPNSAWTSAASVANAKGPADDRRAPGSIGWSEHDLLAALLTATAGVPSAEGSSTTLPCGVGAAAQPASSSPAAKRPQPAPGARVGRPSRWDAETTNSKPRGQLPPTACASSSPAVIYLARRPDDEASSGIVPLLPCASKRPSARRLVVETVEHEDLLGPGGEQQVVAHRDSPPIRPRRSDRRQRQATHRCLALAQPVRSTTDRARQRPAICDLRCAGGRAIGGGDCRGHLGCFILSSPRRRSEFRATMEDGR